VIGSHTEAALWVGEYITIMAIIMVRIIILLGVLWFIAFLVYNKKTASLKAAFLFNSNFWQLYLRELKLARGIIMPMLIIPISSTAIILFI
jgi:hypothetical protein